MIPLYIHRLSRDKRLRWLQSQDLLSRGSNVRRVIERLKSNVLACRFKSRKIIEFEKNRIDRALKRASSTSGYTDALNSLLTPFNEKPFNIKVVEVDGVYKPLGWVKVVFEEA